MSSTEEQLAWEARQRPRAGLAAILAALLSLGGGIYNGLVYGDVPRTSVLQGIERAAQPGPIGPLPSLRIPVYEWYADHVAQFILSAVISASGVLAIGAALTFMAFATGARRPLPRMALYLPVIGAVLLAVAMLLVALGTNTTIHRVLDGPRTVDAVAGTGADTMLTAGQLIEVVARFTLGAAFLLVSLNAMRAGLLTRFMGVLGIIAGVLLALPIFGGPLPVVQAFWLLALGLLLLGRWPSGIPPAWSSGKAEPWPSSAELRQARMAARGAGKPAREKAVARPVREEEPQAAPSGSAHPSSKKKRKKRT
jgi:hypothetical protein